MKECKVKKENRLLKIRVELLEHATQIWKKGYEKSEVDKKYQQKVIKAMATWIDKQDTDEDICKHVTDGACGDENGRPCIECIINHFTEEVKE